MDKILAENLSRKAQLKTITFHCDLCGRAIQNLNFKDLNKKTLTHESNLCLSCKTKTKSMGFFLADEIFYIKCSECEKLVGHVMLTLIFQNNHLKDFKCASC